MTALYYLTYYSELVVEKLETNMYLQCHDKLTRPHARVTATVGVCWRRSVRRVHGTGRAGF
jgi:hypothetical protein